jgi:glycerol kinase
LGRARRGEIWDVTRAVAVDALDDAGGAGQLRRSGITNQRETVCVLGPVDRRAAAPRAGLAGPPDLQPLRRSCASRATRRCCRERTGLVLDPYFSATKIEWLLRDGRRSSPTGARRSGGLRHDRRVADLQAHRRARDRRDERVAHAARDIRTVRLGSRAARALRRARALAAADPPSIGEFGRTRDGALPGCDDVPVAGIAGDQQAALYGQACLDPGQGKNTYGTGSFVLLNAGDEAPPPREGLLTTVAWQIGERTFYALEAAVFVTGAAVQWLRDGLGIIRAAGRPRGSRGRSSRPTASCSSRRSPASARRTGTRTRAGRSWV